VLQVGKGDAARIYRLAYTLDPLHSKWSQKGIKRGKRWRRRKAGAKKMRRFVKCFKICTKTGQISLHQLFPLSFSQTSTVIRRLKRNLKPKITRALASWSHYRFRQRLLQKSREYPWCRVITGNEAYTIKTFGICEQINSILGGRKTFYCPLCEMRVALLELID